MLMNEPEHPETDLWSEYRLIEGHYGQQTAARSGVPLMRHIDEGLAVLRHLGSSEATKRAYCLHPLFQADTALASNFTDYVLGRVDRKSLALALEYRNVANRALLHNYRGTVTLSPLLEVNDMLIADKAQNRKDFERYHAELHPDRAALAEYFSTWLLALGVSEERYQELVRVMERCP